MRAGSDQEKNPDDVSVMYILLKAHTPSYIVKVLRDPLSFTNTVKSSHVSPKGYCTYDVSDAKQ